MSNALYLALGALLIAVGGTLCAIARTILNDEKPKDSNE